MRGTHFPGQFFCQSLGSQKTGVGDFPADCLRDVVQITADFKRPVLIDVKRVVPDVDVSDIGIVF